MVATFAKKYVHTIKMQKKYFMKSSTSQMTMDLFIKKILN